MGEDSESNEDAWKKVVFGMVCPLLGSLVATAMFAAPIADLKEKLQLGVGLGDLNPRPWALLTGNCLGWCAYAYYTNDPFILVSNLPGLVLSLWLNAGAAKLQYQQLTAYQESSGLVVTPQEVWWLRVVLFWSLVLVWVGWVAPFLLPWMGLEARDPAPVVGLLVNLNLVGLYAAPLQTMKEVVREKDSGSIHRPTLVMAHANATFWLLYGLALRDAYVVLPNGVGLSLSLAQAALCLAYSRRQQRPISVSQEEEADGIALVVQDPRTFRYRDQPTDPHPEALAIGPEISAE